MKIYSWNVWFSNARLDDAFAFVRSLDFDIVCLQEVPGAFLERLKTLPCSIAFAAEVDRFYKGETSTQYVAILSRFPIHASESIPLAYHEPSMPRRTHLTASLMVSLGIWGWGRGNRHAVYADLETPQGICRVFNIHLPLLAPRKRAEEFEQILEKGRSTLPTIVCGDFNVLESRRISILNWVLGGRISDTFKWRRERRAMEMRFAAKGLTNPLRGRITHPLSRSQLDHILVSKQFSVVADARVIAERHGSDHCPVFVEVN